MCLVAACSHACHATPAGAACACPAPLHLQRDGYSCAPDHVCSDWGICSQVGTLAGTLHRCRDSALIEARPDIIPSYVPIKKWWWLVSRPRATAASVYYYLFL